MSNVAPWPCFMMFQSVCLLLNVGYVLQLLHIIYTSFLIIQVLLGLPISVCFIKNALALYCSKYGPNSL